MGTHDNVIWSISIIVGVIAIVVVVFLITLFVIIAPYLVLTWLGMPEMPAAVITAAIWLGSILAKNLRP